MRVLGIETSGRVGSVALLDDERLTGERTFEEGMIHGRELQPAVRDLCADLTSIDLVAVDIGPGSYTGLRVGVAAAKGLCYALGKKIIGVASLDALAEQARGPERICPILDAQWRQVYAALYEEQEHVLERTGELLAIAPAELATRIPEGTFIFGDGVERFREIFASPRWVIGGKELWIPKAATIARRGLRAFVKGERARVDTLVPLYLRATEAEENLKK